MELFPISSIAGVLATLGGICAFFFWLERATRWRLFQIVPAVAFVYLVPLALSNTGVLVKSSPVYQAMDDLMLPAMLVLLLLNVNVRGAVRLMGRGVGVMLIGSLGVILGALLGYLVVRHRLGPDVWKAYGALAGSWTGGTANLMAVSKMFEASGAEIGLATLADAVIYAVWLPVLLGSKRLAAGFARFTRVDSDRLARLDEAALAEHQGPRAPAARDYLYLLFVGVAVTWFAEWAVDRLPHYDPYLSRSAQRILLITTIGIALSYTPLRHIAGSQELGLAMIFLYLAKTGASANLAELATQWLPFLVGATIMVTVHGAFCIFAAWLLRTDLHTAAIASAANVGGVAAATIVATHHRQSLVPAAILMALLGFAIGNYCGYAAAMLCRMVG